MKLWNKCICLTSRKSLMVLAILLISTLVLASVWSSEEPNPPVEIIVEEPKEEIVKDSVIEDSWIPTEDDIAYQDSMYTIIQNTQNDIDTIKDNIIYILERLEYKDGSSDSIRYVKNSEIDRRRN